MTEHKVHQLRSQGWHDEADVVQKRMDREAADIAKAKADRREAFRKGNHPVRTPPIRKHRSRR